MGRIKTQIVKRYAKVLLEKFPDKFTDDFESNKRVLTVSYTHLTLPTN